MTTLSPARAWTLCTLLLLASALSFLERQVLSVLAPLRLREFGMTNTDYSHVVFAFVLSYTVMFSLGGRLPDRTGTPLALGAAVALWSAASAAHAWEAGPWGLGFARFLLGAGEGACLPAATSTASADRAFCEGMNRVVWHTWSHVPGGSPKPGWVYYAGSHSNRNVTWWPLAKPFFGYPSRASYLLQQGVFAEDVLFYYGVGGCKFVGPRRAPADLGPGYDYDAINSDAILRRRSIRHGRNELEIEIVNTWHNRLVGDFKLPPAQRQTGTNVLVPGGKAWTNWELLESGLFGPVTLSAAVRRKQGARQLRRKRIIS